jgi:hypothetical protein
VDKVQEYLNLISTVRDTQIHGDVLEFLLDELDVLWYSMTKEERKIAEDSIKDL